MTDIAATIAKLDRLTQAPKTFRAAITLQGGAVRTFDAPSRQLASAWCDRYLMRRDSHLIIDCSVTRI